MIFYAGDKVTAGQTDYLYIGRNRKGDAILEAEDGGIWIVEESCLEPQMPDLPERPVQRTLQARMSIIDLYLSRNRKL